MAEARRLSVRDVLTDGRIALMLPLGFSAGLPLPLVFGTLSAWLATLNVTATVIGFASWISFTYTVKFLWAPAVDRVDIPVLASLLGRRRAWMAVSQLVAALGMVAMALTDPSTQLLWTILGALVVAFASATQDVVIDAWRIDAADTSKQGLMSAAYQLGYRFALIVAGAGVLLVAARSTWAIAYFAMAALMSVGLIGTILAPRVESKRTGSRLSFVASVFEPFIEFFRRKGLLSLAILLFIGLYRMPDLIPGVMANKLYVSLGFSLDNIATVSKVYGVWIGIVGAFAGGFAVTRLGLWPTLLIGAIIAASSNLAFVWLASEGARIDLLTLAISIDNFSAGFAGTALIAYMSGLTAPGLAATQYALLSSFYSLPGKFLGGFSGMIVDRFGYEMLFTSTAAIGIPLVLLCVAVRRDMMQTVQEKNEETTKEPTPAVGAGSRA